MTICLLYLLRYAVALTAHGVAVGNAVRETVRALAADKKISLPHHPVLDSPFEMDMVYMEDMFDQKAASVKKAPGYLKVSSFLCR